MSDDENMISDEAVEAAAKVMQERDRSEGFGEYELYEYTDDARTILEAAAPYIRARALEDTALDFEISPLNTRAKMARHFNNTYVRKLRELAAAERIRE